MKKRTVYECDYCRKRLINTTYMKKHEEGCWYNPKNKTCLACRFNYSYVVDGVNKRECIKLEKELDYKKPCINCNDYEEGTFSDYLEEQNNNIKELKI